MHTSQERCFMLKIPDYTNRFYADVEKKKIYFPQFVFPQQEEAYRRKRIKEQLEAMQFKSVTLKNIDFKLKGQQSVKLSEIENYVSKATHKRDFGSPISSPRIDITSRPQSELRKFTNNKQQQIFIDSDAGFAPTSCRRSRLLSIQ
ncbi:hypothetical protein SS50377_23027 [Spironucleus salmonicida]|uniref:Uncharacterized protein n=1 Tax=Spironucleus salmonicida TaxID=348837 RepID=V6M2W2_9EUKA|nr:hypothetical protein SS50377_23027 [Spironucleus salmonicida]|eukprot:EST47604.1 Hypothetical protein SS50377_12299 [Spironucleus salmonicida]